ncbi:hypothetical protein S245_048982, partial [Arachis hypogaea]
IPPYLSPNDDNHTSCANTRYDCGKIKLKGSSSKWNWRLFKTVGDNVVYKGKLSDGHLVAVKICQKKESIVSILGRRGTIGYIAPEVFSRINGSVLHKSNVYSYGMLILEMVGGRKNYENRRSNSSE